VNSNSNNRQASFEREIVALCKQLGIPANYAAQHKFALQPECTHLVSIGRDVLGREQRLSPAAARGWFDMQAVAASVDTQLQAVSAFRSVDYQTSIIKRKLVAGQCLDDILQVSSAPGYSEHHGGCALDITTPGFEPLEEEFDASPAFKWLTNSAGEFGFRMSYPKNNPHGLAYEPWHWCWHPESATH